MTQRKFRRIPTIDHSVYTAAREKLSLLTVLIDEQPCRAPDVEIADHRLILAGDCHDCMISA
jgi:hypothetical protein